MATTFNWELRNLERGQDDYICIVHWALTGDDGVNSTGCYGTVSFNQEEGEEIIPFADLTEELVWGWVDEKMDRAETEASVQAKLDELANPPLISGIPW